LKCGGIAVRKLFSVPIIGAVTHSEKTLEILVPYSEDRKQSEFIRDSILAFAFKKGFNGLSIENRPEYIPAKLWRKIVRAHLKSYYINYIYAIAFYYLLSLPKYEGYNKSKLLREIIEAH
jgi:hypothetical protein